MSRLTEELHIFFSAVLFYTRIPVPAWVIHTDAYLSHNPKYFPLIGWIVGSLAAGVYWLACQLFAAPVAVVLCMLTSVWVTGAFHEDGLADTCDGFGGGWGQDRILAIMKDSRLGTYGVIGLSLVLLLKFTALVSLPAQLVSAVLIAGHAVSRFGAVSLRLSLSYVRENEDSKAKPIGKAPLAISHAGLAAVFGLLPLFALLDIRYGLVLIPLLLVRWYLSRYFFKRIGGFTGDCLGAAQQALEVVFYLSVLGLSGSQPGPAVFTAGA